MHYGKHIQQALILSFNALEPLMQIARYSFDIAPL
jgi:hypothetical protein